MSTPCNSLNVQLIKISDLANYTALKDADILMTIENNGGTKFSRNSALSDLKSYVLKSGFSSFPTTSFVSSTDLNSLNFYTAGNQIFTYNHSFGSTPSLVRIVLYCSMNDGLFSSGDEVDVTSCFNNETKPVCSVLSKTNSVKVIVPTFTSISTYTQTNPSTEFALNLNSWYFKIYLWK